MMEFLAALSGAGIVVGRMMNAQAGERIGLHRATLNNYWVGLIVSLLAMPAFGARFVPPSGPSGPSGLFMYLGGAMGVAVVMISSLAALRLSALRMTLIVFVSQIAAALLMDAAVAGAFSPRRAAGGALVLAGLWVQRRGARKA